jgi:hypothetical protein
MMWKEANHRPTKDVRSKCHGKRGHRR